MEKFVNYRRVFTKRQGDRGLGLRVASIPYADELNARGGAWHPSTMRNVLLRAT